MCRPKCCQGLRHQYARPSVPHVTQHYCMPHERDPKAYELVTSHDILNIYVWPFVIHAIHLKGHYLSRPWRGSGTHLGIPSYRCTDTPRACSTSHGSAHIPLHQLNSSAGDEDQNKKKLSCQQYRRVSTWGKQSSLDFGDNRIYLDDKGIDCNHELSGVSLRSWGMSYVINLSVYRQC